MKVGYFLLKNKNFQIEMPNKKGVQKMMFVKERRLYKRKKKYLK